ncbi:MAG: hypothetical protein ACRCYU_17250 [Nocardioides sp.]
MVRRLPGQAGFLRVPQAQFGPIVIEDHRPDGRYLYLSDALPTAWQAVEFAADPERHAPGAPPMAQAFVPAKKWTTPCTYDAIVIGSGRMAWRSSVMCSATGVGNAASDIRTSRSVRWDRASWECC